MRGIALRRRQAAVCLALVLVAVLGGWLVLLRGGSSMGQSPASPSPSGATSPCVTRADAFVAASELPGFVQTADTRFDHLPTHSLRGWDPAAAAFTGGGYRGFLASVAINGPDRPAEDAYARSAGYTPGALPLMPLQGPVVDHNPGPLEVYDAVYGFTSADAARSWYRSVTDSASANQTIAAVPGIADDAREASGPIGLNPTGHQESVVYLGARLGTIVLTVSVQGGGATTSGAVRPIILRAVHALQRACGLPLTG